ncbi:metallophosphoesterase family protein [Isoptericola sp. NPDC057559]|uniref:metallophosphoesterase family protein n=1 Tax=Isoptericola sp. NPDC057559 TaxID=3346168 RepID=UPI0036BCFBB0
MSDQHDEKPGPDAPARPAAPSGRPDDDAPVAHGAPARRTPPRWVRWTLVSVAAALACVVVGVTTAQAELSLGPHEAVYEVDTDGLVVADLGPLGTLEIDSPLPLGLGLDVVVKEIPADLSAVDQAGTLDMLAGDLQNYLQFFSSPQETASTVARALLWDAGRRTVAAMVVVVAVGFGLRLLLGAARRRELSARLAPRTWEITAGVAVTSLVVVTVASGGVVQPDTQGRPASSVFAGTALEGATITGRLAGVVDTYGGQLVGLYKQNEEFYAAADDDLVAAWDAWDATHADAADASGSPSPSGTPDEAVAPPDGSATPSPSPSDDDLVTLLVVSDLHCNTGMTPLIRTTAERAGVDVVLNAGDTTMNGTSVEKVCVDSFATAPPRGVPMVVSDGNHDSQLTSNMEAARGQTVLDGKVVEVKGVRILGDRDALETRVGGGTNVARERTPEEQAADLAATACEDGGVDLLLIHTPAVGLDALDTGCVPFQVSGHTHKRSGPEQVGQGIRYVNGSTAGAAPSQPTVGPLHGTAQMTLLRFDPEARRMVDVQVVSVTPDGDATIGDREPVPEIVPPSDDALPS